MPDPKHISTQINQPQVQGNLVVQGDVVIYDNGYQAPRFLSALPQVRTSNLIGRSTDLARLEKALEAGQPVVLNGMGGVGKTSLAISYLQANKSKFAHLAWIEQTGDWPTSLLSNLPLLNRLEYTPSGNAQRDAQLIMSELGALGGPSLLLIDNAESDLETYRDLLPQSPDWQVIITSRQQLEIGQLLELDVLDEEAAIDLFNAHYKGPASSTDTPAEACLPTSGRQVQKIVQLLGQHPLSIELVAKMARARRIKPVDKVLKLLEERGLQLNRTANVTVDHRRDGKVTKVFPYLQTVFEWREANEMEDWLIRQFICLPPLPHRFDLLMRLFGVDEEQEDVWDEMTLTFEQLVGRGWLQFDEEQDSYQMHRVIQEVVTEQLRDQLTREDCWRLLLALARATAPGGNFVEQIRFIPFAERINNVLPLEWLEDDSFLALNRNLAQLYRQLGELQKSQAVLELLFDYTQEHLGPEDAVSTAIQADLGSISGHLGEYQRSLELLSQALQIDLAHHGHDPIRIVGLLSNIGSVQTELGHYEGAEQKFGAAFQMASEAMEEDDPRLLVIRTNLADLQARLGHFEQARDLARGVLEDSRRILGDDYPDTHSRQVFLAGLLYSLGELEEAEKLLRTTLSWQFKVLGTQNLSTVMTGATLAGVLMAKGQVADAVPLFELALQTYLNSYEPGNLVTLEAMMNLAAAYQQKGRMEDDAQGIQDALEMYQMALDLCLKFHPPHHPTANKIRTNLAVAYADFGRNEESAQLLEESYNFQKEYLGEDHPNTQHTLTNLEVVRSRMKDSE